MANVTGSVPATGAAPAIAANAPIAAVAVGNTATPASQRADDFEFDADDLLLRAALAADPALVREIRSAARCSGMNPRSSISELARITAMIPQAYRDQQAYLNAQTLPGMRELELDTALINAAFSLDPAKAKRVRKVARRHGMSGRAPIATLARITGLYPREYRAIGAFGAFGRQ